MQVIALQDELRAHVYEWRSAAERIAFVPPMGNLHAGHGDLVRGARRMRIASS